VGILTLGNVCRLIGQPVDSRGLVLGLGLNLLLLLLLLLLNLMMIHVISRPKESNWNGDFVLTCKQVPAHKKTLLTFDPLILSIALHLKFKELADSGCYYYFNNNKNSYLGVDPD
jgi:hypothetical protein